MNKRHQLKFTLTIWPSVIFASLVALTVGGTSFIYSQNVAAENYRQVEATSEQVLTNYETYFSSAIEVSDIILARYANLDATAIHDDLPFYFDMIRELNPEILSISLYRSFDSYPLAKDSESYYEVGFQSEDWYVEPLHDHYINIFNSHPSSEDIPYSYTLSRYLANDIDSANEAVLKIDFDFGEIVENISPVDLGEGGRFLIYDSDYDLIYSSGRTMNEQALALTKELVIGIERVKLDGHNHYLYAMTIANTGWRVAIFTNADAIVAAVNNFILMICLLAIAAILLFVLVMMLVAGRIANPIRLLQREMSRVASLDYQANVDKFSGGNQEIDDLYDSFEAMMARIKTLTADLVKEKEEQRKSELRALQNQINPHFLYNTLDSIIALIDAGEGEQAEKMIVALSRFFRLSISRGHNIIPLADELAHARNYLLIQKMRHGEAIDFDFALPEQSIDGYYVVKLILQPLIENSLVHGLKEDETTHIKVTVSFDESFLYLTVEDDGYGMKESKVEELRKRLLATKEYKGVGIKNVYDRLRVYCGEQADITIESKVEVGTKITIKIPKAKARVNDEAD